MYILTCQLFCAILCLNKNTQYGFSNTDGKKDRKRSGVATKVHLRIYKKIDYGECPK